ncbi:MAG: tetratricopeptide repeat protein [Candidatus Aminicenantes bacterium]|nr:tetratricopeptide repeat protein [Candidatus Aminicenantes bacterium]
MKSRAAALLFLILVAVPLRGDSREGLFLQGNRHYEAGDYRKALESYAAIAAMGYESGPLYFNMGNCYYKLGETGPAILHYERASRLIPGDEDLEVNLSLARLKVVDRIPELPRFRPLVLLERLVFYFPRDALWILLWSSYAVAAAAWILKLLWSRGRKVAGRIVWIGSVMLMVAASCLVGQVRQEREATEAVILAKEVRAVSAPGEEGIQVFTLHEGTKVRIQEVSGSWVEVLLADGNVGWLKADSMARIAQP